VNEPDYSTNADIAAPIQQLILFRNLDAIKEIVKHESAAVHDEMLRRLSLRIGAHFFSYIRLQVAYEHVTRGSVVFYKIAGHRRR